MWYYYDMDKIITARKKSSDPKQEQLRINKDNWNKLASQFIAKLIAFKRALNGRGDPKFNLPVSNIKNPLPQEVSSFLVLLSSDFENLVQKSSDIIKEQSEYSVSRKKPIKQASSKVSRFWTYISSVFSGEQGKHYRLSLLKSATDVYHKISKLEDVILSRSYKNISEVMDLYMSVIYSFDSLKITFNRFLRLYKNQELSKLKVNEVESKDNDHNLDINEIKKDLGNIIEIGLPTSILSNINNLFKNYSKENDDIKKQILTEAIYNEYESILKKVRSFVKEKYDIEVSEQLSLEDISDDVSQALLSKSDLGLEFYLVKKSGNVLTRWILKNLHQLTPFESTSAARLDAHNQLETIKKDLNILMDELEEKSDLSKISELVNKINHNLSEVKKPINILINVYKDYYLKEKEKESKKKHKDKKDKRDLTDMSLFKSIRRDMDRFYIDE